MKFCITAPFFATATAVIAMLNEKSILILSIYLTYTYKTTQKPSPLTLMGRDASFVAADGKERNISKFDSISSSLEARYRTTEVIGLR